MAFVRYSDESDVYVYETRVSGEGPMPSAKLVCCHGADHFPTPRRDFYAKRYSEMLAHLKRHADTGLKVPGAVVRSLNSLQRQHGDIVRTEAELARAWIRGK